MKLKNAFADVRSKTAHRVAQIGAAASGLMLSGFVFAQATDASGLGTAMTAEVSDAKPVLYAIGGTILLLCAVVVAIRYAKKAAN